MEITIRDSGDKKIIDIAGKLDSNSSDEAQERLTDLLGKDVNIAVINLKNLEFISSAGLRVLMLTAKNLKKTGRGPLRVCCANEQVQDIFGIGGFDTIFVIFNTESEALDRL